MTQETWFTVLGSKLNRTFFLKQFFSLRHYVIRRFAYFFVKFQSVAVTLRKTITEPNAPQENNEIVITQNCSVAFQKMHEVFPKSKNGLFCFHWASDQQTTQCLPSAAFTLWLPSTDAGAPERVLVSPVKLLSCPKANKVWPSRRCFLQGIVFMPHDRPTTCISVKMIR